MAERIQKELTKGEYSDNRDAAAEMAARDAEKQEKERKLGKSAMREESDKVKAETDALMDEIDEVLEQNAEEFVKGYIQKGGE